MRLLLIDCRLSITAMAAESRSMSPVMVGSPEKLMSELSRRSFSRFTSTPWLFFSLRSSAWMLLFFCTCSLTLTVRLRVTFEVSVLLRTVVLLRVQLRTSLSVWLCVSLRVSVTTWLWLMFALAFWLSQPLAAAAVEAVAIAMASTVFLTVAFMVPSLSSGDWFGWVVLTGCPARPGPEHWPYRFALPRSD
ncbi:hypothetical protein D3C73_1159730 [compost metagenome]